MSVCSTIVETCSTALLHIFSKCSNNKFVFVNILTHKIEVDICSTIFLKGRIMCSTFHGAMHIVRTHGWGEGGSGHRSKLI